MEKKPREERSTRYRPSLAERRACSPQERQFRETLAVVLETCINSLPFNLFHALTDHLEREDSEGFSLCFAGPTRERYLGELEEWLTTHEPRLYLRVAATLFPVPHA